MGCKACEFFTINMEHLVGVEGEVSVIEPQQVLLEQLIA